MESMMSALAQLKVTQYTKPTASSPAQQRRSKLIRRLREQMQLAKAQESGELFSATRTRTVTDADTGTRRSVTVPKRVKAWWVPTDAGRYALTVRYGSRMLEFSKGKAAIEVASMSHMVPTLQVLCEAVAAGELDPQIEAASAKLKAGFKR
jgi:hypothetical protein